MRKGIMMKKSLLFSTVFCLTAVFGVSTAEAGYCACAGRCVTGAFCNCSTGACTVPAQQSRYAYGYVDTAAPVVYSQPVVAPSYQTPTPYRSHHEYTGARPVPYIAARVGVNMMQGDAEYTDDNSRDGFRSWKKDFEGEAFSGALAFGVKLNSWRGELEGSLYTDAESDLDFTPTNNDFNSTKGYVTARTVLFNLYYDIPTGTQLTPFIGAGVGLAHVKGEIKNVDIDDCDPYTENHNNINFAWQIGAGLSYALNRNTNVDFGYRYTHYGKVKMQYFDGLDIPSRVDRTDKTEVKDLTSHSISAGLRFSF